MSVQTRLFFIRDEQIVGFAPASLGHTGDKYLDAITDGFYLCVEYFDRTPGEFPEWTYKTHEERYGHYFQSRPSLLMYQYVYFEHNRKIYERHDVHRLIKGAIKSDEFEKNGFELPQRKWEAIQMLSEIFRLSNIRTDSKAVQEEELIELLALWVDRFESHKFSNLDARVKRVKQMGGMNISIDAISHILFRMNKHHLITICE